MMQMSQAGLDKLTKPWEEFVPWPYDDKLAKIHNPQTGRYEQPEYKGGPLRGTLTQGYGHTDAAGGPKIELGTRWSEEYADKVLLADMAPCDAMVNRAIKVKITQHEHDGLADLTFNCPSALPHVAAYINAGNRAAAERLMMQYVNSKGERMLGLVHRRTAEIAWMNTPDSPEEAAATVTSPKAERAPPPKTMAGSTTGGAAVTIGGTAGAVVLDSIDKANTAASSIEEARTHAANLGLLEHMNRFLHSPTALAIGAGLVVALAAYIWWDRRRKLLNDHV